jgi:hypothetical protein
MCGGCSSDNNQTNMTFQSWGVGVISLSVAAGVVYVFCAGLMIWMVAVDGDGDGDRGGSGDGGNGNNEQ